MGIMNARSRISGIITSITVGAMTVLPDVAAAQVPDPGHGTAPPGFDKVTTIIRWVTYCAFVACLVGVIACGAAMAIEHRRGGGGSEVMGRLGSVLIACVIIGAAAKIVNGLA